MQLHGTMEERKLGLLVYLPVTPRIMPGTWLVLGEYLMNEQMGDKM